MNLLSVENLTKTYGTRILFQNISFGIGHGEKVGLVARNGSGKTTLLKIIMGKDVADAGKVVFRKDLKTAFLPQEPEFDENQNVLDCVLGSDNELMKVVREYELILEAFEIDPNEENQEKLGFLNEQMEQFNAWDYEAKVSQILGKFNIHNLNQKIGELSGGQKKRVALARILLDQPDFLIMDEPTNHLDLDMIEWLEGFLIRENITLFLVTHDRYFLDRVCQEIIELDKGDLFRYKGNYEYFIEKKSEREYNEKLEIEKAKNLYKKELDWVRRMPKARTVKSKSRVDAFYDLQEIATKKIEKVELNLDVKMSRLGGKVLEMKKVYKAYGDLPILKGFDYVFKTGERIGIVGKNGIGKSTFLNIIAGLESEDSGKVNVGETVVFGYYSQQGMVLKDDKRVIEVVKDIADVIELSDKTKVSASQMLTLFQFPPANQYNYVSSLSGGEKRRLYLLTILMKNPNFLILDEPTNDLDLLTLNVLEDFLVAFKGCLIIVSHDRYFMDKLVDQLFIFQGNGEVKGFVGNYSDYRDMVKEEEREKEREKKQSKETPKKAEVVQEVIVQKPVVEKRKVSFKEKYEFETLEKEIPALEKKKKEMESQLSDGKIDHKQLEKFYTDLGNLSVEIEEKTLRWLELSELM